MDSGWVAAQRRWYVYTMTHSDALFDDNGRPVDHVDLPEWSVGFDVQFGEDGYHARTASPLAGNMLYTVACYIADLHNLKLRNQEVADD